VEAGPLLLKLAVALLAARAAAELAERFRQPAVLAEIAAGVILGPSLIGLLHGEDVIRSLGELGAVLLLFEVGLHMDLKELGRVGRSALQVAFIGVVTPMAIAYPVLLGLGVSSRIAIFLAAGITATSVGITARVFSDLRALASTEARIVLGAAVADDVAGLVILAIVVGAESASGVAVGSLASTISVAMGFLAAATVIGVWLVPRVIGRATRVARTDGTSMILALVVALALAGMSSSVKLAPVVGAFVAGLAVGPSARKEEIQRRITPIGQVLIPLFFLQIGVDMKASALGQARVLWIAAALAAVAIMGKVVAGLGVKRGRADRLLVGIAMIPRGEVGLIFASIGLSQGYLDARSHSILVVVVMISTVVSPAIIRRRMKAIRRAAAPAAAAAEPDGGWLRITRDEVELAAEPPATRAPLVGLEAAVACASRRPGQELLTWLSQLPPGSVVDFDDALRDRLFTLLREGTFRSWRFLEVTGILARVLPELEDAIQRRGHDPFELDPAQSSRWETLEGLAALEANALDPASALWLQIAEQDLVRLAALARDAFDDAGDEATRFATRIGLGHDDASFVGWLVSERHLFPAAARRLDMGSEDSILALAVHLSPSPRMVAALYVLAVAEDAMSTTERERLDELYELVRTALDHLELPGVSGGDLLEQRRVAAEKALARRVPAKVVRDHLEDAPARYLLAQDPEAIARHIRMIETRPQRYEVRLHADHGDQPRAWTLHLAFLDRHGALASVAGALAACDVAVDGAFVSTWRDGVAIDVFKVAAADDIDWGNVERRIAGQLESPPPNGGPVTVEGSVAIDNQASPWHTIVEVRARDRRGLLYRVASALARAGADIHMAQVTTKDGVAVDTFSVTGPKGGKLDDADERALRLAFAGKTSLRLPGPLRRLAKSRRG
jgi:Kef-type K+ transport system membrane component KefB